MSLTLLLFVLRVAAGLLLLSFVGAIFVMMWRDYRAISEEIATRTRRRGHLLVVHAESESLKPGTAFPFSNGTLLNGYRVEEPIVLSAGDVISVGQVELKLELD